MLKWNNPVSEEWRMTSSIRMWTLSVWECHLMEMWYLESQTVFWIVMASFRVTYSVVQGRCDFFFFFLREVLSNKSKWNRSDKFYRLFYQLEIIKKPFAHHFWVMKHS